MFENGTDKPEVDYSKACYAPYDHPKAPKMFRTLKKKFNIDSTKQLSFWESISPKSPTQDI